MCYDNFDFNGYDGIDDPGDDFQEDIFDDEFAPELDELEIDKESNEFASGLDIYEVMILGGMIVGQAYEEGLDEKEQLKQIKKENKDED